MVSLAFDVQRMSNKRLWTAVDMQPQQSSFEAYATMSGGGRSPTLVSMLPTTAESWAARLLATALRIVPPGPGRGRSAGRKAARSLVEAPTRHYRIPRTSMIPARE